MRERSDFIQNFEMNSKFQKCEPSSHFRNPGIECENGVIAFGASKRVRSFICANRVLTYESSRESRDSKWRDSK